MPVLTSGTFWVSPANANHSRNASGEFLLEPRPSYVDYGPRLNYSLHESEGRTIKQRSAKNPKPRKWVWVKYRSDVPKYESMYWSLFNMQEHVNVYVNSGSPYVYLKENVTDGLTKYNEGTTRLEPDWIRCRIIMVDREGRKEGGVVVYNETELTFVIDDDSSAAVV